MKRLVKGKTAYFLYCIVLLLSANRVYSQSASESLKQGISLYENHYYNAAIETVNYSIENTKINAVSAKQYYWYAMAIYHNARSDFHRSIVLLDSAINKNPSFSEAYFARARIRQFEIGSGQLVIEDYYKALKIAEKFNEDEKIFIRSISKYNLNRQEEALDYLIKREQYAFYYSSPLYLGEVKYALAIIQAMNGETELAIEELRNAFNIKYLPTDFMFIDVYSLRNEPEFLDLMEEYHIDTALYLRESIKTLRENIEIERMASILNESIIRFVEGKINIWQKKGKFEKTNDYQKRVNESNRNHKIEEYTQQAIDSIGISNIEWNNITNEYDADNESFRIELSKKESVFIAVPMSDAPSFDKNFNDLEFNNISFAITQKNALEIKHLEITNPVIGKTYVYYSDQIVAFNPNKFNFSFDEIEVPLDKVTNPTEYREAKLQTRVINVGKSDVDTNIPVSGKTSDLTLALIIGNEDYSRFQTGLNSESNVDFASRDAEIFSQYANKTLGIPSENITLLVDATSVQMQREIEKLTELAFAYGGEASILFYYAGHGFPNEETKESYLMPVDVSGADVRHGIKLNYLYEKLTKYPSKKVIVVLDACFSGGGRNQGLLAARGVQIKPKENVIGGNLVVLTSSTGEQSSLPYSNKQHGMFTYFLLKKLKETKGEINLEALSEYVSREVQINSLKINSKKQNPTILVSPDIENLWMEWKLN